MTSTGDSFFTWIQDILQGFNLFQSGTSYLVIMAMILVACLLISPRKPSNIKVLAFPMSIGFTLIGLKVPLLFLGLGAIIFIMETLSMQTIGNMFEAVGQKIGEATGTRETLRTRKYLKEIKPKERTLKLATLSEGIAKREKLGVIPYKKGTGISDVLEKTQTKEQKRYAGVDKDTSLWIPTDEIRKTAQKLRNKKDRQTIQKAQMIMKRRRKTGYWEDEE